MATKKSRKKAAKMTREREQAQAQNKQTPEAESSSPKSTWENFVAFVQNAIQKISFIKEFFSSVYNYFTRKSNAGTADSQASNPAPAAGFASKPSPRATSERADTAAPTNSIANSIANFFASMRGLLGGKAETPNPSA